MDRSATASAAACVLLLGWGLSCTARPGSVERAVTTTDPSPAPAAHQEILKNPDVFVLDVRCPYEYLQEHIANSVLIPMDELRSHIGKNTIYPEINRGRTPRRDQLILCVCTSGVRSARAAEMLREMGYTHVRSLAGGLTAWKQAGLPVELRPARSVEQSSPQRAAIPPGGGDWPPIRRGVSSPEPGTARCRAHRLPPAGRGGA
jgi:rhodanese-related sulfurtransferase